MIIANVLLISIAAHSARKRLSTTEARLEIRLVDNPRPRDCRGTTPDFQRETSVGDTVLVEIRCRPCPLREPGKKVCSAGVVRCFIAGMQEFARHPRR